MPKPIPHLEKTPRGARLIVDGKPFIMLGGEIHNSSGSSLDALDNAFKRVAAVHANTISIPVSWELLEPEEGKFDFKLVDAIFAGARRHGLKLVLLWFGTWKNGESAYVPAWVKTDTKRFFRAQAEPGRNSRTISPVCGAALDADARAFARLMAHVKKIDGKQHTLLMVQVENEPGMLGAPRDFSPQANAAFEKPVPRELTSYLKAQSDSLVPEVAVPWKAMGAKTTGNWQEVFGEIAAEAFQAWHIGRFIGQVAAAGRAEYDLPMFANCWLALEGQRPGQYPSGGPVSRMMDIWRAAAPAIDLLAPDIYAKEFKDVCASYTRSGNALLIPEAHISWASYNAFWAVAEHDCVCFAPFGIDGYITVAGGGFADMYTKIQHDWAALDQTYTLLAQMMPLLVKYQHTGRMRGILQENGTGQTMDLGKYRLEVKFSNHEATKPARGLVIALADDEYLVAGQGFAMYFRPKPGDPPNVDILAQDDGRIEKGRFIPARRLNGDDTHDRGVHLEMGMGVRRVKVYGWE